MATLIIFFLIMLDQLSKGLAERLIGQGNQVPVVPGFFDLSCLANKGAAWSLFSDHAWGLILLILISTLVSFSLLWFLGKVSDKRAKTVLILLIAGSAGNLIDRLRFGAVTDFLSFTFGSYAFPTFNLADAMITVGAGLLILFAVLDRHFLSAQFGVGPADTGADKEED